MLATTEALQLLRDADIEGIDQIYAFNIPKNQQDNVNQTVVLIRDANTNPDLYAGNEFQALTREIEVQIFYKKNLDVDPEQIELQIYKAFEHKDWDLGENHGHSLDPDTGQLMTTFYTYNTELV